ncbi:hypothetical protein QEN19_003230 [Hanseniaspora menglaensis]
MRIPKNNNPAMRALGIPSFARFTKKLPSRNWMIFLSVVSGTIFSYFYDQNEIKKIRSQYMDLAEKTSADFGKEIPTNMKLRKVKVVIAPLPDDYLESTLKVWRRYIKPVLIAGGVDYDIVLGDQQGKIREKIADELRNKRKKIINSQKKEENIEEIRDEIILQNQEKAIEEDLADKILKKEYDLKEVLGIYYKNDKLKETKVVFEDGLQEDQTKIGGVLCIGRGAYKEYLSGIQEGLLGPVDQTEYSINDKLKKEEKWRESQRKLNPDKPVDELSMPDFIKKNYIGDKLNETENFEYPPKELVDSNFKDLKTGILNFCRQPILLIAQPALYGVINWPPRIHNFFNQRYIVEEYCRQALAIIKQDVSGFKNNDDLASVGAEVEEINWPKKWVKRGVESGSEWVQPISIDERLVSDLKRFETSDCPHLYSKK